jgi:hypothetical protein
MIKKRKYLGLGLTTLVLFFSNIAYSKIFNIVLIDSHVCAAELTLPKNIKLSPIFDAAKLPASPCRKFKLTAARFHGHRVLENALKKLKLTNQIEVKILPINIFDKKGEQKSEYWERAFKKIEEIKPNLIVSAAGLTNGQQPNIKINHPFILAAGHIETGTKKHDIVWPQITASKNENLIIVGHYYARRKPLPPLFANELYRPDNIDFLIPEIKNTSKLNGSSFATAMTLNLVLRYCLVKEVRNCLSKLSAPVKLFSVPKTYQGYSLKYWQ